MVETRRVEPIVERRDVVIRESAVQPQRVTVERTTVVEPREEVVEVRRSEVRPEEVRRTTIVREEPPAAVAVERRTVEKEIVY